MNRGLKLKLLAMLLIPVILLVAGLSFYSYHSAKTALHNQITRTLTYITGDYEGRLNANMVDKEAVVNSLVAYLAAKPVNLEELAVMEKALKASNPGIRTVFAGLETKHYLDSNGWVPPAGFDPTQRPWYKQAMASKDIVYTDVYVEAMTKDLVVGICKQVVAPDGKVIGVAAVELELGPYAAIAKEIKLGKTGYGFILDGKGDYVYHPSFTLADNILKSQDGALAAARQQFLSGKPVIAEFAVGGANQFYSSAPIGKSGWVLVTTAPSAEAFASVTTMGWVSLVISIVVLLLLTGVILYATQKITKPIAALALFTNRLAQGDLSVDSQSMADYAPRDEIGTLVRGFHEMQQQLKQLIRQVAASTEQVAASAQELTASAEQSAGVANQIAVSIAGVANGAGGQLAAANESSAVVEQMSAGIQQVAANTNQVAEQSFQAAEKAKEGGQAVAKAVTQMQAIEATTQTVAENIAKLNEKSKDIGQIVDTISGIAGQTNLLALNAAIEAARAGEQGRGFAVVAEEVRKLAEDSQEAAKKIAELIGEIQGDTGKAVSVMNEGAGEVKTGTQVVTAAGVAFQEIVTLIAVVSQQVGEISAAIQQMASGSQQLVDSIKKIDRLNRSSAVEAQSVSTAAEEQLASMEEISSSSQALANLAQELQVVVARFRL